MKQGRTLSELAREIERQKEAKKDFIANEESLTVASNGTTVLEVSGHDAFAVEDLCHQQIATHLKVPQRFYDYLRNDHPSVLDATVNGLLHRSAKSRMVRTLDGRARAFLSDRYRRLDNVDIMDAILPSLGERPGIRFESCEVTARKLYVKARFTDLEVEVKHEDRKVGDTVQAGVMVTNSEVGVGSVAVEPFLFRLSCLNGMTMKASGLRRHHVGRQAEGNGEPYQFFTDETLKKDDVAFFAKVRDVVDACASMAVLEDMVAKVEPTTARRIEGHPERAVEVLGEKLTLSEGERGGVLRHLIDGGDLTQWGLANAVTRAGQDVDSYDRATDLEMAGCQVIELPSTDWKEVSEAA